MHELLDFLADAGLPRIPRVLGIDDRDREILTFLPGPRARHRPGDAQRRPGPVGDALAARVPRGRRRLPAREPAVAVRRARAAARRDRLPPRQRDVQHGVRRRRAGGRLRLGRRRPGDPAGRRGDVRVEHRGAVPRRGRRRGGARPAHDRRRLRRPRPARGPRPRGRPHDRRGRPHRGGAGGGRPGDAAAGRDRRARDHPRTPDGARVAPPGAARRARTPRADGLRRACPGARRTAGPRSRRLRAA